MAPSATETTVQEAKPLTYKIHLGQYKEIDTTRVDREVEEGKTGEVPAKVSIVNTSYSQCLLTIVCSILTTSQHGTLTKSTLP